MKVHFVDGSVDGSPDVSAASGCNFTQIHDKRDRSGCKVRYYHHAEWLFDNNMHSDLHYLCLSIWLIDSHTIWNLPHWNCSLYFNFRSKLFHIISVRSLVEHRRSDLKSESFRLDFWIRTKKQRRDLHGAVVLSHLRKHSALKLTIRHLIIELLSRRRAEVLRVNVRNHRVDHHILAHPYIRVQELHPQTSLERWSNTVFSIQTGIGIRSCAICWCRRCK